MNAWRRLGGITTANRRLASSVPSAAGAAAGARRRRVRAWPLALALSGGVATYVWSDEGAQRSIVFWSRMFPIYAHYRATEFLVSRWSPEEQDEAYSKLHRRYSHTVRDLVLQLKGFYTKLAQVCSTRDEFIPKEYMEWCKDMQDQVPPEMTPAQTRALVEQELGRPLSDVFVEWEDVPLGAASIGQVHRARLRDGRRVVVKVMYPDIERRFRADIKTVLDFCELAQPQHVPAFREIERQFLTEFDYQAEAKNLAEVRENLRSTWSHAVVVPEPMHSLCTQSVLVMEYLEGEKLVDGVRSQFARLAALQGRTLEDLEREQKEKLEKGILRLETPEEAARRTRRTALLLRVLDTAANAAILLYNVTLGLLFGAKAYRRSEIPLDLGSIMRTLLEVHAHEIFVDGVFNGDPHPGNVLLLPDGRLGLIDYGQVKRLSTEHRRKYAKLILALEGGNEQEVCRLMRKELGFRTKRDRDDILFMYATFWNDYDNDRLRGGRNVQHFMEWLEEEDPIADMPDDYVLASRVSILLRGVGNAFGLQIRTTDYWAPYARRFLLEHGDE